MNRTAPYNTAQYLWENYRKANPEITLKVVEGMLYSNTDGWIARFENSDAAVKTLRAAGYSDERIKVC